MILLRVPRFKQPDDVTCGPTCLKQVFGFHGLDVELHGGGLAHRHIMAALRNTNYYELGLVHPNVPSTKAPIYPERRWLDELDSVDANGCVAVPEGPGLGVPFDWDYINAQKTGEVVFA